MIYSSPFFSSVAEAAGICYRGQYQGCCLGMGSSISILYIKVVPSSIINYVFNVLLTNIPAFNYNPMISKILLLLILPLICLSTLQLSPPCELCHLVFKTIQSSAPSRPVVPFLEQVAYQYCVRKHLQDKNVCQGAIKQMTRYIITGLWRHHTNPHTVCQDIFMCKKQYVKRNLTAQIATIIKDKPNKEWQRPSARKILKVMHISDLHPDLFYSPGYPVDCTEPVCCRNNVTAKGNSTKKSGHWGSLGKCDLPIQTFDVFLGQVKKMNLDAIIWTGDNTPHDIWQQSQSYNLNFTIMLAQKIKQATNATVIAAMGNHQSFPVNVYDYSKPKRQEVLHGGLATAWKYWLDDRALKMQREKGYYSMVYPLLNNVRVISMNTQAGNDQNWFLLQDPSDPGDMLKWIESQLSQSEKLGQKVYLIGHIPPKSNLNDWAIRFNALVDRYSYIIRGQFYGHTHSDHVSFFPQMKNTSNISTAPLSNYYLVSPSLTTYSDRVPEYRVMDVDFDTLQVIDYAQYRLDLRKYQTADQKPQFQLLYKFRESYKVSDMTVQGGMTEFRNKLRDNPDVQKLYETHRCGGLCQGSAGRGVFCDSTSAPEFESQCNGNTFKKSSFEKAAGPWREFKHKDQE